MDGNTYYYIVDGESKLYKASIKINSNLLPFLRSGDKVKIKYREGTINNITSIEK